MNIQTGSASAPALNGFTWRMQILLFFVASLVVVSRRPDAIFNPQFYAEDGIWYAQAYALGFGKALVLPFAGYLVTLQRLTAGLSLFVPLVHAPLFTNLVAITVQILPFNLLCSAASAPFGSISVRLVMGFAYLALPNSEEINANLTNAQWHLALVACIVLLASVPTSALGQIGSELTLILAGLTGPFCVFLLPIAIGIWFIRRHPWRLVSLCTIAICAVLQSLVFLYVGTSARIRPPLGASFTRFVHVLAGNIYLTAIFGTANYKSKLSFGVLLAIAFYGSTLILFCVATAKIERKLFLIFSLLAFAASLRSSLVNPNIPQWQVMDQPFGARYYFFPTLSFVWALIWLAQSENRVIRCLGAIPLIAAPIAIVRDWEYPAFPDRNFVENVNRFRSLPPKTGMTFSIIPDGWVMQISKNPKTCAFPEGYVDQPLAGAREANSATVKGWVIAPRPIRGIFIDLDGVQKKYFQPSLPRPDVDRLYPDNKVANKGWEAAIDLSHLSPGPHEIGIWASLGNGCNMQFGKILINRVLK